MKYLRLIRIRHWVKNLLIFFPVVFSGLFTEGAICWKVIMGFFSFCNVASIVYVLNDLKDIDKDRGHPEKRNRPLASGEISKKGAVITIGVLAIITILISVIYHFPYKVYIYQAVYLAINIGYSLGLKNVPLVDVAILSAGYLLRLLCGGELAGTGISDWMFLTVVSAAFFLGFGKRRNELLQYGEKNRKILERYTEGFLDKSIQLFCSLTIVFYSLSCADKNTAVARRGVNLMWSVPLVILVLLRYNMILENGKSDGDPVEVVQKDRVLLFLIAFYGIAILILIYGSK